MTARLSGKRARHRGLTASLAATVVAVAVLATPGVATATPPTPTITASQVPCSLTMQLKSDTGTHWSWTFLNAAAAVVGTSTLQARCRRSRGPPTTPPSWMPPTTIRSPRPQPTPRRPSTCTPPRPPHSPTRLSRTEPSSSPTPPRASRPAGSGRFQAAPHPACSFPATADRRRKPAPVRDAYGGQPGRGVDTVTLPVVVNGAPTLRSRSRRTPPVRTPRSGSMRARRPIPTGMRSATAPLRR